MTFLTHLSLTHFTTIPIDLDFTHRLTLLQGDRAG